MQALHTLWQNYKTGMLQKALEEVLITDDLQKLSDGQEIILNVVLDEKMYRDVCLELMLNNKQGRGVYMVINLLVGLAPSPPSRTPYNLSPTPSRWIETSLLYPGRSVTLSFLLIVLVLLITLYNVQG